MPYWTMIGSSRPYSLGDALDGLGVGAGAGGDADGVAGAPARDEERREGDDEQRERHEHQAAQDVCGQTIRHRRGRLLGPYRPAASVSILDIPSRSQSQIASAPVGGRVTLTRSVAYRSTTTSR